MEVNKIVTSSNLDVPENRGASGRDGAPPKMGIYERVMIVGSRCFADNQKLDLIQIWRPSFSAAFYLMIPCISEQSEAADPQSVNPNLIFVLQLSKKKLDIFLLACKYISGRFSLLGKYLNTDR